MPPVMPDGLLVVLIWSTGAMLAGFALDMLFGDPYSFPHIARLIGRVIAALEKLLRRLFPKSIDGEFAGGIILTAVIMLVCAGIPFTALFFCYRFFAPAAFIIESFLCWQLIAVKSLKTESMKVRDSLAGGDLDGARKNLSMIVGRDTCLLDEAGITRAAVETVSENASDGVTAPLLYTMLGGAALGCLYKAVNTADSMIGYMNSKYLFFGRASARTDDFLNFIPARVCALLMIVAAFLLRLRGKDSYRVWKRDRLKHASPNSAQTESVCAGALGIRLAGPVSYFGKLHVKPFIGDDTRPVRADDIAGANRLMFVTSVLTLIAAVLFRLIIIGVILGVMLHGNV